MQNFKFLLFSFILLNASLSLAISKQSSSTKETKPAPTCVNDPDETRGLGKNQSINNALKTASDPLTQAFNLSLPPAPCAAKPKDIYFVFSYIFQASQYVPPSKSQPAFHPAPGGIKAACIQASLLREVGNTGYSCNKGKPVAFDNSSGTAPCLNQQVLNFVQFSVNQAIACMSPPQDPIDPRVILRKINNETGFNFYVGYEGGVGIGQLTSSPVDDIAGWWSEASKKRPARFNEGNAHGILETLVNNPNPACAPFKKIIAKELETPPPSPGEKQNYCAWLSTGEGLGRSLVYGLGYYVYARDHYIKDTLEERAPGLANNKDLVNTLTLVAYGPGGPAQAKSLIRTLRLNSKSNPEAAKLLVTKHSAYVTQTDAKMHELMKKMDKENPSAADLRGDTCITR